MTLSEAVKSAMNKTKTDGSKLSVQEILIYICGTIQGNDRELLKLIREHMESIRKPDSHICD